MAKKITEQGIFNFVYKFILKQGVPATDNHGNCVYRGNHEGRITACAVGCLLSDEEVALIPESNDSSVKDLKEKGLLPERFIPFYPLLRNLQQAHDRAADESYAFISEFKSRMTEVATWRGLKIPE